MRINVRRCAICNLGFIIKKDTKITKEQKICNKCRKNTKVKGGETNVN